MRTPEHPLICDCWTSHSKSYKHYWVTASTQLFTKCEAWLEGFAPIQPQERERVRPLMLGDKVWLAVVSKMLDVVDVSALCKLVKLFPSKLGKIHVFMHLALCIGGKHRKGPFPNCCRKVGSRILCKISLYIVRFPLIGTKQLQTKCTQTYVGETLRWSGQPGAEGMSMRH